MAKPLRYGVRFLTRIEDQLFTLFRARPRAHPIPCTVLAELLEPSKSVEARSFKYHLLKFAAAAGDEQSIG